MKTGMEISQKAKNRSTIWLSNSISGYMYPKKTQNRNSERCTYLIVHSSVIYNSQGMEATQMSINGGMNREDTMCVYKCIWYIYVCIYSTVYIYVATSGKIPFFLWLSSIVLNISLYTYCIYIHIYSLYTVLCIYIYAVYIHIYILHLYVYILCVYIYSH